MRGMRSFTDPYALFSQDPYAEATVGIEPTMGVLQVLAECF